MNVPSLPQIPPPGAHALTLPGGTVLWLLPQRAVAWPAARMAFVADVHFGKAATFRRAGQPVPHGTTADNLARLDAVLCATGAQHLVFLGDFLHARSGADEPLWAQLQPWRERHAHIHMTLVRGNHDLHAGDPPPSLSIDLADEPWHPVPGAEVLACHHPQAAADGTVMAGHLHPTVMLQGLARDALRVPCFAWEPGLLVLPAFGAFTGTSSQSVAPSAQPFAVAGDRILPLRRAAAPA
ncbi:ligase-associated DNA damage response endonuclease PdeM [Acidovorax sp. sic0104]|uniref:ligase-associated DNA damage response endonuclease PdeM n=1 Tax=Acidovorax sp. sic0104 TaxID=2854784 RepID=UPI001C436E8E|nr:ligase-associated DNA damage response endonuclease PdeM [Acidovorax sp. sic0104]MBV7542522.1 ligase-associated DNA damage response endonuclease PdeM [Acidovorax sp. sic0104]